jgi:hypothetical protein
VIVLGARLCLGNPQIPPTVTIPVCAVASPRDRDFQRRLSAELRSAATGSAVESVVSEWLSLRDQARAFRSIR